MDEEAFLSALRDDPGDKVTWAALADWLDDSGQAERAELLRLLRRPGRSPIRKPDAAAKRAAQLLAAGVEPTRLTFTNSVGMAFVLVQPGAFLMGSPRTEEYRETDEKQHEVTITKAFWIGVHPVTQGQWKAVMGNNPAHFSRPRGKRTKGVGAAERDRFPVEQVSWQDVQAFLARLATLEEQGRIYRLPTEAQWEYACRGGHLIQHAKDGHTLPFHFARPTPFLFWAQANFDGRYPFGDVAEGPDLDRPSPVGSYDPNRLGLYDLHGNVWEWCADWCADGPPPPATDPIGPADGELRGCRGGSYRSVGMSCRAAAQGSYPPESSDEDLGFRAVAVPRT